MHKKSRQYSTKMYLHGPCKGRNKGSVDFCTFFECRMAKLLLDIRQACYVVRWEGRRCEDEKIRTHEKWQSGRYTSVETWVHDVLKYVDDRGDQRKTPIRRIIEPFGIAEVIGCFVVQVWMACVLGETKKRHEGIYSVIWCENRRNKNVTKVSGEKCLNLQNKNWHLQCIWVVIG